MRISLSTQDFQKSIPFNIQGISEIIEYSAKKRYHFIEIRDVLEDLTNDNCEVISEVALKNNIVVIYVIGVNLLDAKFHEVFQRGLSNTSFFPNPGILRTMLAKSEFDAESTRKVWNKDELIRLTRISVSCASVANTMGIQFLVENTVEAFFGDSIAYYGIADFLNKTSSTGFQIDIGNLFRNNTRVNNDPKALMRFLPELENRWVMTHLKTAIEGKWQPVLTDNPITFKEIIELMGKQVVNYVMLE